MVGFPQLPGSFNPSGMEWLTYSELQSTIIPNAQRNYDNLFSQVYQYLWGQTRNWEALGYNLPTQDQLETATRQILGQHNLERPELVPWETYAGNWQYYKSRYDSQAGSINNLVSNPNNILSLERSAYDGLQQLPRTETNPTTDNPDTTDTTNETESDFNTRKQAAIEAALGQFGGYGEAARNVVNGTWSWGDLASNIGVPYEGQDAWGNYAPAIQALQSAMSMTYSGGGSSGGGGGYTWEPTPYPTWDEFLKYYGLTTDNAWAAQELSRIQDINKSIYGSPATGEEGALQTAQELLAGRGLTESGATPEFLNRMSVAGALSKDAARADIANQKAQELLQARQTYGKGYLDYTGQLLTGSLAMAELNAQLDAAAKAKDWESYQTAINKATDLNNELTVMRERARLEGLYNSASSTPSFGESVYQQPGQGFNVGDFLSGLVGIGGMVSGPVGQGIGTLFNFAKGLIGGQQSQTQAYQNMTDWSFNLPTSTGGQATSGYRAPGYDAWWNSFQ